jgi:hypothetical protein
LFPFVEHTSVDSNRPRSFSSSYPFSETQHRLGGGGSCWIWPDIWLIERCSNLLRTAAGCGRVVLRPRYAMTQQRRLILPPPHSKQHLPCVELIREESDVRLESQAHLTLSSPPAPMPSPSSPPVPKEFAVRRDLPSKQCASVVCSQLAVQPERQDSLVIDL